jgi:hypothetical protein
MPVIPVNRVVDKKRIIGKNGGAEVEERHYRLLTPKNGIFLIKWFTIGTFSR